MQNSSARRSRSRRSIRATCSRRSWPRTSRGSAATASRHAAHRRRRSKSSRGIAMPSRARVLNLIDNAIKYSGDENKLIDVVLRQTEESVVIEVKDRGIGIDASDLAQHLRAVLPRAVLRHADPARRGPRAHARPADHRLARRHDGSRIEAGQRIDVPAALPAAAIATPPRPGAQLTPQTL